MAPFIFRYWYKKTTSLAKQKLVKAKLSLQTNALVTVRIFLLLEIKEAVIQYMHIFCMVAF